MRTAGVFWALFEVQPDGGSTRISGQFRFFHFETRSFVQTLRDNMRSTLTKDCEVADRFEHDGVLFGASAPSETATVKTFPIPGKVHPIDELPNFQLNGAAFVPLCSPSKWAPGHNFCIALMPSRTSMSPPLATSP
jgi:hypothetical protein